MYTEQQFQNPFTWGHRQPSFSLPSQATSIIPGFQHQPKPSIFYFPHAGYSLLFQKHALFSLGVHSHYMIFFSATIVWIAQDEKNCKILHPRLSSNRLVWHFPCQTAGVQQQLSPNSTDLLNSRSTRWEEHLILHRSLITSWTDAERPQNLLKSMTVKSTLQIQLLTWD